MTDNDERYEDQIKETEMDSSELSPDELRSDEMRSAETRPSEFSSVQAREADLEWQHRQTQGTQGMRTTHNVEDAGRLASLRPEEIEELRTRWSSIQTRFVDDPHTTIRQADELVTEALQRIQQSFSDQRTDLENRWNRKEDISTEDLRVGLQSYRSFFNRLLDL